MQVNQWMWHTNAMSVVRITAIGEQCERIDGAKDQMVSVTFSSFQHGACTHVHSYADNGLSYETFASCLIPLEQAPSYVSDLLRDWVDAIEEDKQRAIIDWKPTARQSAVWARFDELMAQGITEDEVAAQIEKEFGPDNASVFSVGDTVRIKAHPGYVGIVRFINVYRGETTYSVEFPVPEFESVMSDAKGYEIERVPFGWDKV